MVFVTEVMAVSMGQHAGEVMKYYATGQDLAKDMRVALDVIE